MKNIIMVILFLSTLGFAKSYHFSKNEIGLIRKLKIYKTPKWVASIKVRSGKEIFFSSPKSMFEFYHRPGRWPEYNVKTDDDMRIYVTDFFTLEKIDARSAFYVYGSTVTSRAGDDLVAFKKEKDAKIFTQKNSGKRLFLFRDISAGLIRYLNGNL